MENKSSCAELKKDDLIVMMLQHLKGDNMIETASYFAGVAKRIGVQFDYEEFIINEEDESND